MMLLSDSVGGADASRNGFSKEIPVNVVDRSAMASPFRETLIIDSPAMRRFLAVFLLAASPLLAQTKDRPLTALPYTPSLDIPSMDQTANPCVDFYQYTCGGWMKNNPIPGDQASWSVYGKVTEENGQFLWGVLEDAAKPSPDRTAAQQKIGDYFQACMDESHIESLGATPLRPLLDSISALKSKRDLAAFLAAQHVRDSGSGCLLSFGLVW